MRISSRPCLTVCFEAVADVSIRRSDVFMSKSHSSQLHVSKHKQLRSYLRDSIVKEGRHQHGHLRNDGSNSTDSQPRLADETDLDSWIGSVSEDVVNDRTWHMICCIGDSADQTHEGLWR